MSTPYIKTVQFDASKPGWWNGVPGFKKKCFSCFRTEQEVEMVFTSSIPTYPRFTCVDCNAKKTNCTSCNVSIIDHDGDFGGLCYICIDKQGKK